MIYVGTLSDLEPFGIKCLTSESCAYGIRLLFDLNQEGADLISEFLGSGAPQAKNWNSEVDGKPAVASILLPREIFIPLSKYLLFRKGCAAVLISQDTREVFGLTKEEFEKHGPEFENYDVYRNSGLNGPVVNGRVVHAFSGRTT